MLADWLTVTERLSSLIKLYEMDSVAQSIIRRLIFIFLQVRGESYDVWSPSLITHHALAF